MILGTDCRYIPDEWKSIKHKDHASCKYRQVTDSVDLNIIIKIGKGGRRKHWEKEGIREEKREKEGKGGLFWNCKKQGITDNKKT